MANYKVETMKDTTMCMIGESPFYDSETGFLYYVDIIGATMFKLDTATNKLTTAKILGEKTLSFMIPVYGKKDQFIIGAGKRLLLVNWDGTTTMAQTVRVLTELMTEGLRFNDAKTDSKGRLYLGTMISEEMGEVIDLTKRVGSLYKFTMTEGLVELKGKVGLSNGLTWNDKLNKFYYVDSYDLNIKTYDFDQKTGMIGGEKILADISTYGKLKTNVPDGMTIDQDGTLYVAMFGGGKILKINTMNGKVMGEITFPVSQITSMTFGGKMLDTMFVTTAGQDICGKQMYPAGYMMKVTGLGVTGCEMTKFTV